MGGVGGGGGMTAGKQGGQPLKQELLSKGRKKKHPTIVHAHTHTNTLEF